jgi:hypothetical protein
MKNKKVKFDSPLSIDFLVLAIVSHEIDFKFCFDLNQVFSFDFERQKDLDMKLKNESLVCFPFFRFYDSELGITYDLISNKQSKNRLVKGLSSYDYLLRIEGNYNLINQIEFIQKLNNMPNVIKADWADTLKIPSIQNLIL